MAGGQGQTMGLHDAAVIEAIDRDRAVSVPAVRMPSGYRRQAFVAGAGPLSIAESIQKGASR